jgi:putative membrane protein
MTLTPAILGAPMAEQPIKEDGARFEIRMTSDSHFSWFRTRMSLERTLMSWVRTAISLIGFGFTIVQFFERFADMQGVAPALRPQAPRLLGLSLILAGCAALAISAWQYRAGLRYLWSKQFAPLAGINGEIHQTPLFAVALILLLIGIFTFVAVLFRLV